MLPLQKRRINRILLHFTMATWSLFERRKKWMQKHFFQTNAQTIGSKGGFSFVFCCCQGEKWSPHMFSTGYKYRDCLSLSLHNCEWCISVESYLVERIQFMFFSWTFFKPQSKELRWMDKNAEKFIQISSEFVSAKCWNSIKIWSQMMMEMSKQKKNCSI